jgi:uncharacterized protein (TIGR00661 family)
MIGANHESEVNMSRIFYSVGGEGRGHATRVRTVIEELRHRHTITLFAPGHAYELLAPVYNRTNVIVKRIPGMLQHNSGSQLNYIKTGLFGAKYLVHLPKLVHVLKKEIQTGRPDLVITDFEASLPRAAKACGVPFISLDHQHFLVVSDLSSLPEKLRKKAVLMGKAVKSYYGGQCSTIVSSFYFPPVKPEFQNVTQTGILLRPEIVQMQTENRPYLVAYLRRCASANVLESLAMCGLEVRVYGLSRRPSFGCLRFYDVDIYRFVDDLTGCRGLVSTAGNQLVGEALYLGKPVLAMPEPKNYEQEINAHYLCESGGGLSVSMNKLDVGILRQFLDKAGEYKLRFDRNKLHGNPQALEAIQRHLPEQPYSGASNKAVFRRVEAWA